MRLVVFIILFVSMTAYGQTAKPWKGKQAAIVLTYDDAINVHLDHVVKALDSLGLKGTFYLTVSSGAFVNRQEEWKKAAKKGHELANHTMYHPCVGNTPGREWVRPEYNLATYSVKRIADEAKMTNVMLQSVDGKTIRTFAYPCGDMTAGGESYVPAIKADFVSARGVAPNIEKIATVDLYNVGAFSMVNSTADEMIAIAKKAMEQNGLAVFLFHGVGGEHSLNVSRAEHNKFLAYLKKNEKDFWIAPFVEVTEFIRTQQPVPAK